MLVHEGGYGITRAADGAFEFRTPHGRIVNATPPLLHGRIEALIEDNADHGIYVSAETCDSHWDGARVDYHQVFANAAIYMGMNACCSFSRPTLPVVETTQCEPGG